MLSEIFMLRLEAILRQSTPTLGTSDARFVPLKALPASPTKDTQQTGK
jgi:hypothetical protein